MEKDVQEVIDAFEKFLKKINKVSSCDITVTYSISIGSENSNEIIDEFNKIIKKHGKLE